jgi:hypothetical protein
VKSTLTLLTALLLAALAVLHAADTESALFYQPSLLADRSQRFSAWSHSIAVRDGRMFNAVSVQRFGPDGRHAGPLGLAIAESDDGVHWRETDAFACPLEYGLAGYCVRWTGNEFIYFSSERNQGTDRKDYPVVLRQHRSRDLKSWEPMSEEFTTRPDKRWYRCRWDELVILEDDGQFYGYITSEPRSEFAQDSMGMLKSADGLRWEVLLPPVFEWDGLPPQQMEVCFCEKIGGRYYLGMGSRSYLGHLGFSVVVFVSDSPTGPFRPDKDAFRLCGNTTRDTNWLAKTLHWKGEILVSNWITTTLDKSFPGIFGNGQSLWIGPLKKLIADKEGHARIVWWPGNDASKGAEIPVNADKTEFAHPAPKHRGALHAVTPVSPTTLHMKGGRDGAIALLPGTFDFTRGIILEGTLKATEPRGPVIGTHWLAAAAGFYFEEEPGKGTVLMLETLGLTRSGPFEYQPEPAFDADESRVAAHGNANRSGPYLGLSRFTPEDIIGPLGYAVPCGIRSGTVHHFRLIVRHGIWELYLDDRYVQACITGPTHGRLGLFAKNGPVEFTDLRCSAMTPDSHKP